MNRLRSILDRSEPARGYWTFFREPLVATMASKCGYDFVCIDGQHGTADQTQLGHLIEAVLHGDATPLVRVEQLDEAGINRVLDCGAQGVIVPMINSADDARAAVRAAFYPPLGDRSMGAIGATVLHGDDYFERSNDETLLFVMIETVESLEHLAEIAGVPGVNGLFVGPSDLGVSMGLSPSLDDPDPAFQDALRMVVEACEVAGIVAGIYSGAHLFQARAEAGFTMQSIATDWDNIADGMVADLSTAQLGKDAAPND